MRDRKTTTIRWILTALLAVAVLAACGGPAQQPQPTPDATVPMRWRVVDRTVIQGTNESVAIPYYSTYTLRQVNTGTCVLFVPNTGPALLRLDPKDCE